MDAAAQNRGAGVQPWRRRIIVVSRNPEVRDQLAERLREVGACCEFADSTDEALAALGGMPPEVVVVDWAEDEEKLAEFFEALRRRPGASAVVIVPPTETPPAVELHHPAYVVAADPGDVDVAKAADIAALRRSALSLGLSPLAEASALWRLDEQARAMEVVRGMIAALEARDRFTAGHSERVAALAELLGRAAGLRENELAELVLAALLHDIGKLGVSRAILTKPGPLDEREWAEMRLHPTVGANMVDFPHGFSEIRDAIEQHHERPDGQGYPHGLRGDEIHPHARIIAIADGIDAMSSERPYRPPLPPERVLLELERGRGKQWDGELVDLVLEELADAIVARLEKRQATG